MRDDYDWKSWLPWAKKKPPLEAPEFTPEEIEEMSETTGEIDDRDSLAYRSQWIEDIVDDIADGDIEEEFGNLYLFGTSLRGVEDPYTLKAIILWLMWHRKTRW